MELVTVDFDRRLHAPLDRVQRSVLAVLQGKGFKIVRSEAGRIEARRGSQLRSALGLPDSAPVWAQVSMSAHGGTSLVRCHLGEAGRLVNDVSEAARRYAEVFWGVQQAMDEALAPLDPESRKDWPEARFTVRESQTVSDQFRTGLVGAAEHLPGGKGLAPAGTVVFRRPDGREASFDADDYGAQQTVLGLVASQPGALPENLATELEEFAVKVEDQIGPLTARAGGVVEVTESERRIVEFLHQQVELRKKLPVREVYRCRECRFEKVVNPDFKRLQARNRRWRSLTGMAGIGITSAGVNVFLLAGRLFNMRQLDPDYICPRCQGLEADQSLATICPGCGSIRKEAVLRTCPSQTCQYDFRTLFADRTGLWHDPPPPVPEPEPAPVASIATMPVTPGPAPAAAVMAEPDPAAPPPAWYPDPYGAFEQRWWDGVAWTAWVATGGVVGSDPRFAVPEQQAG